LPRALSLIWTDDMDFSELVTADAVAVDVVAANRRTALERAAALLATSANVCADEILAALLEREKLGTTGFGAGTAIPHGRVAGMRGVRGAIVRLASPVDWDAVDGLPVDVVVALSGPDAGGADNLKALALVSRALRDKALVAKLRGCRDAAALWALAANGGDRKAA